MVMASVTSLGVHKPSALPFLISEGILPVDPSEDAFTWQTGEGAGPGDNCEDEELVATKYCVVWSRGGVTQRVFRFDVEGEPVTQALFTHFPSQNSGSGVSSHDISNSFAHGSEQPNSNGQLNVHKRRSSISKPIRSEENEAGSYGEGGAWKRFSARNTRRNNYVHGRALVVLLKTQAHVFFLSGTSHIVHLPFEVDAAFPCLHGILLQRKLPERVILPPTPRMPSVPNNSFACSQHVLSCSPPSSQPLSKISSSNDIDSPFLPMLKNLLERSTQAPENGLPRLFCLTDPLAEIGTVAAKGGPNVNNTQKPNARETSSFNNLDAKESLLYVSPRDELSQCPSDVIQKGSFILAVTENEDTGVFNVWTVDYMDHGMSDSISRKFTPNASGTIPRRRSSFAPGIGTGTTTPSIRGAGSARESFGGTRSRRQVSSDPTLEEDSAYDQDDPLDTAFGNPTIPAKSSRRVSGLLARADLSTSYDRTTFTDLASVHAGAKGARKGASFGGHGTRLSAGLDTGTTITKPHTLHGIRTSLDSVSLHEPQLDELADEIDDLQDLRNLSDPGLHAAVKGLRKEIILTKVYTMPAEGSKFKSSSGGRAASARRIFTMKMPELSLGDAAEDAGIIMCFLDSPARETLVLQIRVHCLKASSHTRRDTLGLTFERYKARVTGMTRRSGVIDVCSIGDGVCSRLLYLDESKDGKGELTLQAPWSLTKKIALPSSLYQYDPFKISTNRSMAQRREGGLKRVLSHGPQALVALQHGGCQGRVDVLDSEGTRHRLQLQFWPRNSLVRKIIEVSESVLLSLAGDAETMLRGWWDTMSWLQAYPEPETDVEWTAVVVLLFSMGVAFIGDRRMEAAAREKKKKKGGLLRSSSGANTDLNSWENMLARESRTSGVTPAWMKDGAWEWTAKEKVLLSSKRLNASSSSTSPTADAVPIPKKSSSLIRCVYLAREFLASTAGQTANGTHGYLPTASSRDLEIRRTALASVLLGLHLLREELKLDILTAASLHQLTPILVQIGTWLHWETWGNTGDYMLESKDMEALLLEDSHITAVKVPTEPFPPPSILRFIESTQLEPNSTPIISLLDVANSEEVRRGPAEASAKLLMRLTPRMVAITNLLKTQAREKTEARINKMAFWSLDLSLLETLPESVAAPFRAAIASCQAHPPNSLNAESLKIIGREDIAMLERNTGSHKPLGRSQNGSSNAIRDIHSICHSVLEVETVAPYDGSAELDRQSITRLLFKEDQRFAEAAKLVHPLHYPIARCAPEPEWSDTDLLEAQQELAKVIAVRTLSVSSGRGLLFYSARLPVLTEKFPIHGFTMSCIMKPADTTVTADRNQFTEDKISWAFFHAGVAAGLSISKDAKGIDTSWILFNKPKELNNRHAGFLLALGLNGHLKSIAKWVAFKYLTPKHTITSIGLLLGLSASYMGTMDTLITRLLSVHVTRMLPQGAAELNLSPLTQTSGLMGIGLLYCNTQHRRMSEIMLSEMENSDQEDASNPLDSLRDEGYRLAAGFALGYINLGRGKDLKGLHDMRITERLLVLAVSTRTVSIVHILDKAAAAATVAIALIFMKTKDEALARKIDIPDTTHQFDYVRPDLFLHRTVARHLIMWENIQANARWMSLQLPLAYQPKASLTTVRILTSEDMPFFNIIAGLCLSIGLRFAGSGSLDVRNLLCHYIDQFIRICRLSSLSYDGKLARQTVRNCQDVVALAASCVMAGTGDLHIFRRLRSLHGRTDADTPYGSHLATHFAIGVLFMGGGTHTFGTSNVAVASLLCAIYPLFPNTVLDNKSHLQAFRHFWVLATERRCLIIRDVDTHRPVSIPILLTLRTGDELEMTAPCLLPELQTIAKIQTNEPEYWSVNLDIAENSSHHAAFTRHQSIYVRRRAAYDAHASVFSATMQALNDAHSAHQLNKQAFSWIFTLPTFSGFDRAEQALVLPVEGGALMYKGTRGTVVDDRLVLEKACLISDMSERLWNLRILFAWADGLSRRGEAWGWFGKEIVENLKAGLAMRRWRAKERW